MIVWVNARQSPRDYIALLTFLTNRIWGEPRAMSDGTIMAVVNDGAVKAVALFHNYQPDDGVIEISLAGDGKRWMTRPVLFEMFSFPFDQLKCQAVVTRTDAGTPLALRQAAYGFHSYTIPRLRGRDRDEVISVLTEESWRANGFHKEHRHGRFAS